MSFPTLTGSLDPLTGSSDPLEVSLIPISIAAVNSFTVSPKHRFSSLGTNCLARCLTIFFLLFLFSKKYSFKNFVLAVSFSISFSFSLPYFLIFSWFKTDPWLPFLIHIKKISCISYNTPFAVRLCWNVDINWILITVSRHSSSWFFSSFTTKILQVWLTTVTYNKQSHLLRYHFLLTAHSFLWSCKWISSYHASHAALNLRNICKTYCSA